MRTLLLISLAVASAIATMGSAAASSAADQGHPSSQAEAGSTATAGRTQTKDAVSTTASEGLLPASDDAATEDDAHILVMRIYWSDEQPESPDDATMGGLMKDTAAWFKRVSRGRHQVTSTVTPWLEVEGGDSNCTDLAGPLERALAAARALGYDTSGYNRFMVVSPQCASTSYAELSGQVTWIREATPYLAVILHELGHNLGLGHANSSICSKGRTRVTQGGTCTTQEYGDMWDAMGLSTRPYSVAQLQRLGWAGRVETARGAGTWKLRDAERSGRGIQALRVRSGGVTYWLEYHTNPVALAKSAATMGISGVPGLEIRLDTGADSLQILDADPGHPDEHLTYPDADFVDVALAVGSTFTTPQGVRITVVSQGARTVTVQIS